MIALESLNVFLDSLEEGIIFLDKSRRVVAINKAAQQMIGGRREDVAYSAESGHPVQSKLDSRSVATRGLFFTPDSRFSSNLFCSF